MFEKFIFNFLKDNPISLTFLASIWDRSGIPSIFLTVIALENYSGIDLKLIYISAFIGCYLGDQLFYMIGFILRKKFIPMNKIENKTILNAIEKIENYFFTVPKLNLIFFRFLPKIGKYITFFAGYYKFKYKDFMYLTAIGSFIYISFFVLIASFIGSFILKNFTQAQVIFLLACIMIILLLYKIIKLRRQKKNGRIPKT